MLRLIFILAIFIGANALAQDCETYVHVVTDEFGNKTPTANNAYQLNGGDVGFVITTLATQNTVVIIVDVTNSFPCVAAGDLLEVSFEDESRLRLINMYNENCDGRSAVYLGPFLRNVGLLTQLSTKAIASLTVWTKSTANTVPFDKKQAFEFRETLKCLGSFLQIENYKGDSIPEYKRPVYDTTRVVKRVEVQPEYDGGFEAMMTFIRRNLKYPTQAKRDAAGGAVYVSFIINEDGSIEDPKVLRSIHPALDAEAVRVVSLMPKWKPGMINGIPVKVRFNLPIKFRITENSGSNRNRK